MNIYDIDINLTIFNDQLQRLRFNLNPFNDNKIELEDCKKELEYLEEMYSQICANLYDNRQTEYQSNPDT